ncbi:unnamed protein product, partial [Allacma fusca]
HTYGNITLLLVPLELFIVVPKLSLSYLCISGEESSAVADCSG